MGVVANPIPSKNFDGKIFLERVSKTEEYKKMTHNQNFTDDASANGLLKDGDWIELVVPGMLLGDLKEAIVQHYSLDEDVGERLILKYYRGTSHSDKAKAVYLKNDDDPVPEVGLLRMDGHQLMVRYKKGDKREVDVTCDSQFMTSTMPKVGQAIRDAYEWVPPTTPI